MPRPKSSKEQRQRARHIQKRLRKALDDSSMELEDLARKSEVNRRTLDKYLQGESPNPSFFLLARIARPLGLNLDDLATETLGTDRQTAP